MGLCSRPPRRRVADSGSGSAQGDSKFQTSDDCGKLSDKLLELASSLCRLQERQSADYQQPSPLVPSDSAPECLPATRSLSLPQPVFLSLHPTATCLSSRADIRASALEAVGRSQHRPTILAPPFTTPSSASAHTVSRLAPGCRTLGTDSGCPARDQLGLPLGRAGRHGANRAWAS